MNFRHTLLAASVLLYAATPVNAALVDQGKTTLDTESGLEWLDLSESRGYTVNDILNNRAPALAGWRLAALPEVQNLFVQFGFGIEEAVYAPTDADASAALNRAAALLGPVHAGDSSISVFGTVNAPKFDDYANGYFYPLIGASLTSSWDQDWNPTQTIGVDLVVPGNGNSYAGINASGAAHFLVRTAVPSVPEPATSALFLLGSALLACRHRQKAKAASSSR
ncbi:MAG: PEP-CTERM sorting domain-containing protein [Pseudomonadota bacterium]